MPCAAPAAPVLCLLICLLAWPKGEGKVPKSRWPGLHCSCVANMQLVVFNQYSANPPHPPSRTVFCVVPNTGGAAGSSSSTFHTQASQQHTQQHSAPCSHPTGAATLSG